MNLNNRYKLRIGRIAMVQFIAVVAICFFSSLNAYASTKDTGNKIVRLGYYENGTFQSGAQSDKYKSGYSYDYMQRLSVYTNWTYEYVYGEYGELYDMLVDGKIDLLTGLAYVEDREDLISYPEMAMGETQYTFLKRIGDDTVSANPKTFNGKIIGTIDGAMRSVAIRYLEQNGIEAQIVLFDDIKKRDIALVNGEIDIALVEGNGTAVDNRLEVFAIAGGADYYVCVNKQRPDLLDELNYAQDRLLAANPLLIEDLRHKWSKQSVLYSTLTESERNWIENHSELRVGYYGDNLPYCGKDKDGNVSGIIKDVVEEILSKLNISDIDIKYVEYDSFGSIKSALNNDEIDVAFPAYYDLWTAENNNLAVTNEVLQSYYNLIYKDEYPGNDSAVVAMTKQDRLTYSFKTIVFPKNEVIYFDSLSECVDAVAAGKADFCMINVYRTDSVLREKDEYKELRVAQAVQEAPLCFLVGKKDVGTLEIFNHGIELMESDFALAQTYKYEEEYVPGLMDYIKRHIVATFIIGFIVATLIIGLISRELVRNKKYIKYEEEQNQNLQDKINEISQLNIQLNNNQLKLEEAAYDHEEKIKEITILNDQLQENQRILEEGRNFATMRIQTMSEAIRGGFKRGRNDKDYSIIFVSEQFAQMLGYDSPEEFMRKSGGTMLGIVHEDDVRTEVPKATKAIRANEIYTIDYRIRCKDGSWKNVEERGRLIRNPEAGEEFWSFIVDRDELTQKSEALEAANKLNIELEKVKRQLEAARDEAEAASQAKTFFLFNMSHDIRTPMNAIMGFRDLLEKYQDIPEKRADYLKKIDDSCRVLLSIINNVLEMARIEKGAIEIEEKECNVGQIVKSINEFFEEMMAQKDINFVHREDVIHPNIYCDSVKIKDIFINILSNAYKYTNPGGDVRHTIEEIPCDRKGYARIRTTISDTGIGMSEEFLPHLFDEFAREKNTTDIKIEGTGLGMPIVKKYVDIMGGTIDVKSEKNVGTTISVTLEHKIADESAFEGDDASEDVTQLYEGKRILLAEDNELNSEIIMEILKGIGFDVDHASDGQECVDMLIQSEAGYYSLILMDIQMPNLNGYEAAMKIRALEDKEKSGIKILAVTANAFEEDRHEALKCGMNGHVAKPINIPELIREINSVLF